MIMIYFIRFVANLPAIRNLTEHKTQRQDRRTTNQRVERYGQVDKEPAASKRTTTTRRNIDHDFTFLLIHCDCFIKLIPILMRTREESLSPKSWDHFVPFCPFFSLLQPTPEGHSHSCHLYPTACALKYPQSSISICCCCLSPTRDGGREEEE